MTDQRKVTIAQVCSRNQVWVTSSASFDERREMFKQAEQKLKTMVDDGFLKAFVREDDTTLIVTLSREWATVEDQFLQAFLPGLCGVSADFAIYDARAQEPRRRFTLRINDKLETLDRVLQEDILINM